MKVCHKIALLLLTCHGMHAQDVFGKWKTIDDASGKAKAIVEVYKKGGKIYGVIRKVLEKGEEDAVCKKCNGDLKNKPIVGINVVRGLVKNGDTYEDGKLLDPENGKEFRGKIWLNPDNPDELMVRGYVAFFYRTQIWHRVK
ncbi:DUF2147 domain-containing protein [Allomuricauda sp. SCSIO 65647]|uniref:DUF2147 domain-containing protein n=1 Tax=Allomuricauda sp. SCSIO 65647 TaxID=2908843 RepID=UPI001F47717F|nr:DUF2147 domain-containing protein [Muricauda sp. SCSIO 65647]UJH67649.1 DUF2147 domain-containing protein [Muricauda sp. SCSIO 65647]